MPKLDVSYFAMPVLRQLRFVPPPLPKESPGKFKIRLSNWMIYLYRCKIFKKVEAV